MKKSIITIIASLLLVVLLIMVGCSSTSTATTSVVVTSTQTTMPITTIGSLPITLPILPTVTVMSPGYGDTGQPVNTSISATFSEAMSPSTISKNTFTLWQGTTPIDGIVSYSGNTAVFNPAADLAKDTTYTAKITTGATDLSGKGLAADFVWSFTTGEIDTIAPFVSSTIPSFVPQSTSSNPDNPFGGSINVPINDVITAYFNEAMDPSTINSNTFTLMQGAAPVMGTVTFNGDRTAVFTPSASLSPNTTYTATITTGATCLGGNTLAQNFVWSFTTGPAQTTVPMVISTVPASGSSGLPINSSITATFSEAVNPMTINNSTFILMQGNALIPGTVNFDGVSTAVFDPTTDLAVNGTYTVTITTGVTDLAGIPLASNVSWSFMTGSADTVLPTIVSTSPNDGDQNVATNSAIVVTFSEPT